MISTTAFTISPKIENFHLFKKPKLFSKKKEFHLHALLFTRNLPPFLDCENIRIFPQKNSNFKPISGMQLFQSNSTAFLLRVKKTSKSESCNFDKFCHSCNWQVNVKKRER